MTTSMTTRYLSGVTTAWASLVCMPSCSSPRLVQAVAPPAAANSASTTGTPQVYVTVRALGSESEIRTRVTGIDTKPITVPGSGWACSYRRLFVATPIAGHARTAPYPMRLHAIDCTSGDVGASVSLNCPEALGDLIAELERSNSKYLGELLVLIDGGTKRNFVTLSCE